MLSPRSDHHRLMEKKKRRAPASVECGLTVTGLRTEGRGTRQSLAIEYALIGVGIPVAILAAVQLVGSNVLALYDTVASVVSGV